MVWWHPALAFVLALLSSAHAVQAQQADPDARTSLGARATVARPAPQANAEIEPAQANALKARLGDSFAAPEALPGVVPVFSGVPYVIVRGAPPAGTLEVYDDIPVPAFHHIALGPAIAHGALVSGMRFHAGVAPARYGRRLGAVVAYDAPREPHARAAGEVELRLLDSHALVQSADEPAIAAHARIAYPGAWLDAFGSDAVLYYGDYQLRAEGPLSPAAGRTRGTVHLLGAFDQLGARSEPDDDIMMSFHRALVRLSHRVDQLELGSLVVAGHDRGTLGDGLRASTTRVAPALWLERPLEPGMRLRVGADMEGRLVAIDHEPVVASAVQPVDPNSPERFLPSLEYDFDFTVGPEEFIEASPLRDLGARSAWGAYVELELLRNAPIGVELGLRTDAFVLGGRTEHSVDPRMLARAQLAPELSLHAGVGTAHQASSSPLPLPGIGDVELDYGLQRALQTELGLRLGLPEGLELSLTGFYHRFADMVFLELVLDCEGHTDPAARMRLGLISSVCSAPGLPRGSGDAYGVEAMLARARTGFLTGWLSYTLGFAHGEAEDGTEFTPLSDVRHLLNLVLGFELGAGFSAGLRSHLRSGKAAVNTIYDLVQGRFERQETRLPPFFRTDVHVAYAVATGFGRVVISAGVQNVTLAQEATKRDCRLVGLRGPRSGDDSGGLIIECEIDYQPAIVLPNLGVRAEL